MTSVCAGRRDHVCRFVHAPVKACLICCLQINLSTGEQKGVAQSEQKNCIEVKFKQSVIVKLKQGSANHEAAHWHFQTVWGLKRSPSLRQTSRVYLDDRFCASSRRMFLQVVLPKVRTLTVNVCAGKWTHTSGKGRLNSMHFHFALFLIYCTSSLPASSKTGSVFSLQEDVLYIKDKHKAQPECLICYNEGIRLSSNQRQPQLVLQSLSDTRENCQHLFSASFHRVYGFFPDF